jgi:hypothetical protein
MKCASGHYAEAGWTLQQKSRLGQRWRYVAGNYPGREEIASTLDPDAVAGGDVQCAVGGSDADHGGKRCRLSKPQKKEKKKEKQKQRQRQRHGEKGSAGAPYP